MNIWGERFAEVDEFASYCRDLNVETERRELEHYEKTGVMFPVARVVYPDEYVIKMDQSPWNEAVGSERTNKWPALGRLSEGFGPFLSGYEGLSDGELIHCFDREMEVGSNPHLVRPGATEFRPWSDYRVAIPDLYGIEIKRPTAKHYYSYWQVHQLYLIQQYPDLYKNAWLIKQIPDDDSKKKLLPRAINTGLLVDFRGMKRSFDTLSFWITGCDRERGRTFASVAEVHGVRILDDVQAAAHKVRLVAFARKVTKRFQITRGDLYGFLRKLINLFEDYERKERYKLAGELKRDIFAWEDLLTLTTGETRDDVAEQLGKVNRFDKQTFRWLDIVTKERDYALDLLMKVAKDCTKALRQLGDAQWSFAEPDANDLLNYREGNGVGLFAIALSGMVAIGDDEYRQKSRRVQRYTNLKNVLNSYEYLLKNLATGAGLNVGGETFTGLVRRVMSQEPWYPLFQARKKKGLLSGNNTQEFLTNLGTLLADNELKGSPKGYWAQNFLIMCLARNMTVHSYPSEDSYYGDLFGPMLDALIMATLYTWQHAKSNAWV